MFAAAVILPNEIGTDELPASNGKHLIVKVHPHSTKPTKNGPAAFVVELQNRGLARCSGCLLRARLGVVPPAVSQHSSPLTI